MNPNGWERNLTKGMNDQKNEWTKRLKFWNDWMDGWKNKKKEGEKEGMNEPKNDIKEILRNSNFEMMSL
jgi:hypothetical protein